MKEDNLVKAYRNGYRAGQTTFKSDTTNPYDYPSVEYECWIEGYKDATEPGRCKKE